VKKYVDDAMEAASQGLSLLEKKAIGKDAERYYTTEYSLFQSYACKNALSLQNPSSVDVAMTKYMNHLFLQGHPSHRGDKLMAAYMHRHPEFNRSGSSRLPHSFRALKGWRKLAPGSSRKAFPLAVWSAIAVEMVRMNLVRMAVFTMTCLSAYTRPSELYRCRTMSLIPPTQQVTDHWSLLLNPEEFVDRSKTGEYDDSILLDSRFLKPWASVLYRELKKQPAQQLLWDFDYQSYYQAFVTAAKKMQIEITPYNMRHSGPSIDRSQNTRPLLEVQKRGRWRSHKSVTRYEKSARLAANFNQLPLKTQRHCLHVESLLGDVMLGRTKPPAPP